MVSASDLALLPALDALLSERNVTRAAAVLGISQPALSAKLARLRDLTGDRLLVPSRRGQGMMPTPRAMALRTEVEAALLAAETVLRPGDRFDPARANAILRILANDNAAAIVLAGRLADIIVHRARGLRVAVLRPDKRRLVDQLEAGEADLAVALGTSAGHEGLHKRLFLRDGYATAQRRLHPRGAAPLDLDAFCAADHLLVSEQGGFDGLVDAELRKAGRRRRVSLSVHSYLLAPLIVAESDLLVTLPRRLLAQHEHHLDLFEPPLDLESIGMSLFWHERSEGDALNRWVRQQLLDEPVTGAA